MTMLPCVGRVFCSKEGGAHGMTRHGPCASTDVVSTLGLQQE